MGNALLAPLEHAGGFGQLLFEQFERARSSLLKTKI
jgi:hypothetical protein